LNVRKNARLEIYLCLRTLHNNGTSCIGCIRIGIGPVLVAKIAEHIKEIYWKWFFNRAKVSLSILRMVY
jgi:hypothetical protein